MSSSTFSSAPAQLRVLHICSDYAKQAIYREMVTHLDALQVQQCVYVPVRSRAELDSNRNDGLSMTSYQFSYVLRPWHRLLFMAKIRSVYSDLMTRIDASNFNIVHAHFLYSDGAVALELWREHGVPFVVAVRNTDVNVFMRWRRDLLRVCCDIIAAANRVIFITPAYVELLQQQLPRAVAELLREKASVIPNGLSQYWIDSVPKRADDSGECLRLLYVGDFTRNKNIPTTIRAASVVSQRRPVKLTLVGGGGDGENEVAAMLATGKYSFVHRTGPVRSREDLARIYRDHDIFVMPSFRETFGVAYLEALSQGLPIVYTRNQGVDGYFGEGGVGEAVDPRDEHSVASGIFALAERLEKVRNECIETAREFAWPIVAEKYLHLYTSLLSPTSNL